MYSNSTNTNTTGDGDNATTAAAQDFRIKLQNCKNLFTEIVTPHQEDEFGLNERQQEFYTHQLPESTHELLQATYALRRAERQQRQRQRGGIHQNRKIDSGVTAVELQEANMVRMVGAMLERNRQNGSARDTLQFIAKSIRRSLRILSKTNNNNGERHCMMELLVDGSKYSARLSQLDWEASLFHLPATLKAGTRRRFKKKPRGLWENPLEEEEEAWKVVYVYVLGRLAFDELSRQAAALGAGGAGAFDLAELKQRIGLLLSVDKTLRFSRTAETGTTLFLVDLLVKTTENNNNNNTTPAGLSIDTIQKELEGNGRSYGALTFVEELTGLHYYAVAAFCAQRLMRLVMDVDGVAAKCEVILHSHNDQCLYLDTLQKEQQEESSSSSSRQEEDVPDFALAVYPLKVELDVLLSQDNRVLEAIGVATRAEKSKVLSIQDKKSLYGLLWYGLLRLGLLFHDRQCIPSPLLLANCFVPNAGKIGFEVFVDNFHSFIGQVSECQDLPQNLLDYVKTISHQALLRLLINRFPIPEIMRQYKDVAQLPSAYTTDGVTQWAKTVLETKPQPPSDWDRELSMIDVCDALYNKDDYDEIPVADDSSAGLFAEDSFAEDESRDVEGHEEDDERPIDVDEEEGDNVDYAAASERASAMDVDEQDEEELAKQSVPAAAAPSAAAESSSSEEDAAAADEYPEYQDSGIQGERGNPDEDELEDERSYETSSDETSSGSSSGDDDIADEVAEQPREAEVFEIYDSSEESASSHEQQQLVAQAAQEGKASTQHENVDVSVHESDEEDYDEAGEDADQQDVPEQQNDATMWAEVPEAASVGVADDTSNLKNDEVVGDDASYSSSSSEQVPESKEAALNNDATQKSPSIHSTATGGIAPHAEQAVETFEKGETGAMDVEMEDDEDEKKPPPVSFEQNESQESSSQVEAGYEAEESQDAATEEEYERPQDSIEIERAPSQADSSVEKAQGDSSGQAVETGVPLAAPVQASIQVDPGYDAEDSHEQTDADDVPSTQIAKKNSFEAGYLAGDSRCPTEEEGELSEANRTAEDDDEQRKLAEVIGANDKDGAVPVQQQAAATHGDLSDMDAADEDSELDERRTISVPGAAVAPPYYLAATSGQQVQSLQDFAAAAQKDDDTRRQQQAEAESPAQPKNAFASAPLNPLVHAQPEEEQEIVDHIPEAELEISAQQRASDSAATTAGSQQDMSIETEPAEMEVEPESADVLQDDAVKAAIDSRSGPEVRDGVGAESLDVAEAIALAATSGGDTNDEILSLSSPIRPSPVKTSPDALPPAVKKPSIDSDAESAAEDMIAEEPNPSLNSETLLPAAKEESNDERVQLQSQRTPSPSQSPQIREEANDSEDNGAAHQMTAEEEGRPDVGSGTPSEHATVSATNKSESPLATPSKRKIDESQGDDIIDTRQRKVARKDDIPSVGEATRPESPTHSATKKSDESSSTPQRKSAAKEEEKVETTPARSSRPTSYAAPVDSPAAHARSHDDDVKEEKNDADHGIESSSDDENQMEKTPTRSTRRTDVATIDSPARHTRSHDAKKEEKHESGGSGESSSSGDEGQAIEPPGRREAAIPIDSPAISTRSHDAEVENGDSDDNGESSSSSSSSSDDEGQAKETQAATPIDSPAVHTRSHDAEVENDDSDDNGESSSSEEPQVKSTPNRSTRRTAAATRIDSPAIHTRSHDAKKNTPARRTPVRKATVKVESPSVSASTRSRRSTRSSSKKKNYPVNEDGSSSDDEKEVKSTSVARRTRRTRVAAGDDNSSVSASTRSRRSTRSSSKKKNDSDNEGESSSDDEKEVQKPPARRARRTRAAAGDDNSSVSASTRSRRSTRSDSRKRKADEAQVDDSEQETTPSTRRSTRSKTAKGDDSASTSRRTTRSMDTSTAGSRRKTRSHQDDDDLSTGAVRSRNTRSRKEKDDDDDSSMQTRTGRKKRATAKPPLPPSTRSTRSTSSRRK